MRDQIITSMCARLSSVDAGMRVATAGPDYVVVHTSGSIFRVTMRGNDPGVTTVVTMHATESDALHLRNPTMREEVDESRSKFGWQRALENGLRFCLDMERFIGMIKVQAIDLEGADYNRCSAVQLDGGYLWERQQDGDHDYTYLWSWGMMPIRCVESFPTQQTQCIVDLVAAENLERQPAWV